MSMRDERTDPIDALIDDAARQLVAGEPSSALRSSVRDRIDRRQSTWSLVPALAGASALAVVAVMLVGRTLSGPPGGPDKARPTIEHPVIERAQAPGSPGETDNVRPTSDGVQLTRRLAAPVAPPPEEDPPIPPINIEPLATAQIAVNVSSGVIPIEIEPLQIEPLRGGD